MPLHDWTVTIGWEAIHLFWITELARHLKARLPAGFRTQLEVVPPVDGGGWEGNVEVGEPTPEIRPVLYVARAGSRVAAVELVSPLNKDPLEARTNSLYRYAGDLAGGIHLLLIDVHPQPAGFSFADEIARTSGIADQPRMPPPMAITYRVGEPAPEGGRHLSIWRRSLEIGADLPTLPLPLDASTTVPVDLGATYARAAADAYLE